MGRMLAALLTVACCAIDTRAAALAAPSGPEPALLSALRQLEGTTVTLRLDVIQLKWTMGGADALHVYQNGEVAYKAKTGFKTVEFATFQEFNQAMERQYAGTKTKINTVAAGTQVKLARVERDNDNIDVFFNDPAGHEQRIRFAQLKGAGQPIDASALIAKALDTGAAPTPPASSASATGTAAPDAQSTAPGANWKTKLRSALEEYYQPAREGWLSDRKAYGKTLILKAGGVWGDLDDGRFTPYMTAVRGGKVVGEGGRHDAASRVFVAGEQVFATRISLGTQSDADYVDIHIAHATPVDFTVKGTTQRMRFKAGLRFFFAKDRLSTATAKDVAREIAPVLETEDDAKAPKTIALGQTPDEVKRALGEPERIVDLGAKKIFVYKDMKVIFMDGKVSDVQ